MIKLTAVQAQVLTALGVLVKAVPIDKTRFSLTEIYECRLEIAGKQDPNGVLRRTTQTTLEKLRDLVPQLVTGGVTWGLTVAGRAVVDTQLGVT